MKSAYILLTVLILFSNAQQPIGAPFLIIWPTARSTAMAGALTAICNDASANHFNAAELAFVDKVVFTGTHCHYLQGLNQDIYYQYFGLSIPLQNRRIGFDITYLYLGTYSIHDYSGNYLGYESIFRFAPRLNYANRLSENLSYGFGFKVIYSRTTFLRYDWYLPTGLGIDYPYGIMDVWPVGLGIGMTYATDLNLLYKPFTNLNVGFTLHNLGPNLSYTENGKSYPLPLAFNLGIGYQFIINENLKILISGEVNKILPDLLTEERNFAYEIDEAWKGIGLEAILFRYFVFRIGYFRDIECPRKGFTFGGGIYMNNLSIDVGVDENLFEFPTNNRKISLSYRF